MVSVQNTGCILADFMGLGKTCQVISALCALCCLPDESRPLLVDMALPESRALPKVRHGVMDSAAVAAHSTSSLGSHATPLLADSVPVSRHCVPGAGVDARDRGAQLGGGVSEVPTS